MMVATAVPYLLAMRGKHWCTVQLWLDRILLSLACSFLVQGISAAIHAACMCMASAIHSPAQLLCGCSFALRRADQA